VVAQDVRSRGVRLRHRQIVAAELEPIAQHILALHRDLVAATDAACFVASEDDLINQATAALGTAREALLEVARRLRV
jgi:hypothetical protein